MAKGLRFKDAEKARDEITSEQLKQISKLYNDWADEIAKKAEKLKQKGTMSSELQEQQMKDLEKALRKTSEKVANEINKAVKEGMTKICQSVIVQNEDWMESLGFPKDVISAAFSSVPDNVVRNIVTGKIYDSGWSLSKSIWGDNEDTMTKIHQIVAGGMAENKPIYEIAKELEQYVRPGAKKQWNLKTKSGKMIYPKRVDYNAQRLARTLSQHAYQQTIKTTSKENPFIQKIKWHSVGNRACEICKKRNGKIYPIDELPMDHPHGFCIMEQLVDDNIDDRLIDWVHGKADKDLDKFAKKLGFNIGDMDVKVKSVEKPVDVKDLKNNLELYVGGGYENVKSALTKEQFEYIKKNVKQIKGSAYRIEESMFTADGLKVGDSFEFSGDMRSFTSSKSYANQMAMDDDGIFDDPVIFKTVGSTKGFDMKGYTDAYYENQSEVLIGGEFEVVSIKVENFGGVNVKVYEIKQKTK